MRYKDLFTKPNIYMLIIFLCALVFGFDYSILHGFFPHFAPKKNVSIIMTGLLYSEYEIIILLLFPAIGKLAPIFGGERLLFLGTLILGVSSFFSGLAYFLPSGFPFISATFISRIFSSIGSAFGHVVNPAMIATIADYDKVCTMIGTLESLITAGVMLGPTLGSVLFKYGGYLCPFVFIGAVMITLSMIVVVSLPTFKSTTVLEGKLFVFIFNLNFWANIAALFAVNFTMGFQSVSFYLYCKEQFQMSPVSTSLAFLGDPIAFVILSPFVGMLNDSFPLFLPHSIWIGLFISALSLCLMAPLPFLRITPHISLTVVSCILFGIGNAFVISPVYTILLNIAIYCGLEDDFKTYSIVSSCHGFSGVLALALGPIIGVIMYKQFGYGYSCGAIALFMFVVILFIIIEIFVTYVMDMSLREYHRNRFASIASSSLMHYRHVLYPNILKQLWSEKELLSLRENDSMSDRKPLVEKSDIICDETYQ